MNERDWRWKHLETQPYLRDVKFKRAVYTEYRVGWDHDHCVGCWAKFAEQDGPEILHEGYTTTDEYPKGAKYEWVCPDCFSDFKTDMNWIEIRT